MTDDRRRTGPGAGAEHRLGRLAVGTAVQAFGSTRIATTPRTPSWAPLCAIALTQALFASSSALAGSAAEVVHLPSIEQVWMSDVDGTLPRISIDDSDKCMGSDSGLRTHLPRLKSQEATMLALSSEIDSEEDSIGRASDTIQAGQAQIEGQAGQAIARNETNRSDDAAANSKR